jgi:NAD(P)-dependent dehydrogenase (short-subunit alcohol dehydrogenase family)
MILITGASRGIGLFLLEQFIRQGEHVIGTFNRTKPQIELAGQFYQLDVSSYEAVEQLVVQINPVLENITLINCAGISYSAYTHKSDPSLWKRVIEVNLFGTYNFIRLLLPLMREQKYGRIINFSSVAAQKGTPGISAYAASKSALWGMTKSLAVENGSLNITVNNINLGYVEVGMGVEQVPISYQKVLLQQIPSGLFCKPEDIFSTIQYLRNTPYINGASIDLNGALI